MNTTTKIQKKQKFTEEEIQKLINAGFKEVKYGDTIPEEDRQFQWGKNLHDDEEYISKTVETTTKKGIFEVTNYTWRYICQTYFCKGIEEVIETTH